MTHDFILRQEGQAIWQAMAGSRFTQALRNEALPAKGRLHYNAALSRDELLAVGADLFGLFELQAAHPTIPPMNFSLNFSLPHGIGAKQ
jgi:hypothetical protein